METLAVTLLEIPVPVPVKGNVSRLQDSDYEARDDVFFSLMQEPVLDPEQAPESAQTQKAPPSSQDACEAHALEEQDIQVLKDFSENVDGPGEALEISFPDAWKQKTQEAASQEIRPEKTDRLPADAKGGENLSLEDPPAVEGATSVRSEKQGAPSNASPHQLEQSSRTPPLPEKAPLPKKDHPVTEEKSFRPVLVSKEDAPDASARAFPKSMPSQSAQSSLEEGLPLPEIQENILPFVAKEITARPKEPFQKKAPASLLSAPMPLKKAPLTNDTVVFASQFSGESISFEGQRASIQFDLERPDLSVEGAGLDKKSASLESTPAAPKPPVEAQSQTSSYRAISLEIQMPTQDKPGSLKLRLDPAHLGRVEVKVHLTQDGRMDAVVHVAKSETFELLQKDGGALQKTIAEAFGQEESALSFTLTGGEHEKSQENPSVFEQASFSQSDASAPKETLPSYGTHPLDPARMLDALV